jgi:hypothetical protein
MTVGRERRGESQIKGICRNALKIFLKPTPVQVIGENISQM